MPTPHTYVKPHNIRDSHTAKNTQDSIQEKLVVLSNNVTNRKKVGKGGKVKLVGRGVIRKKKKKKKQIQKSIT